VGSLSAVLPVVTNRPERVASASEILAYLGREWPGIQVHLPIRAVEGTSDKPQMCADLATALASVSADWFLFIEDDAQLGAGFASAVRRSIARMEADSAIAAVALFHGRTETGSGFVTLPAFRQSQALVLSSEAGLLWLAGPLLVAAIR
jgi:hypothetical protein